MIWFSKRRKEMAARLHLSAVADSIGARSGTVLKEESIGGLGIMSAPITLVIVTLQKGQEDAVAQAQIDAAKALGYASPLNVPFGQQRGFLFSSQAELPQLSITLTSAGKQISYYGKVPDGFTGVTVSLT